MDFDLAAGLFSRGLQINAALYLAACTLAGLLTHNPFAWRIAIIAAGVAYIAYAFSFYAVIFSRGGWLEWTGQCLAAASIVLAAAAGLALLVI